MKKLSKNKKESLEILCSLFVSIYIVINLFAFASGCSQAGIYNRDVGEGCYDGTHSRIEYFFPGYRIGCYLWEPLKDEKKECK